MGSHESRSSHGGLNFGLIAVAALAAVILLWLIWNGEAIAAFKEEAGPLTFFGAMALLPAVGFPLTPFFVVAGATFGTRVGLLGSAIALSLNLALCYWIARSGLRRTIASLFDRFDYKLPDFEQEQGGVLRFVVLVKITPGVPGFVKNYLLGLVGVPFWTFFIASLVFTGAYALVLVLLGESLRGHDLNRTTLAVAVVLLLAIGIWWWRRARSRGAA